MQIKWSSEAALEIVKQLERAGWALEDCESLIESIRTALRDANPDGENRALCKASERFERDAGSLKAFAELLNDTLAGVKRADQMMTDVEKGNISRADEMEEGRWYSSGQGSFSAWKIDWSKLRGVPMPYFRINRVPLPQWLEEMTADPRFFTFMG